MITDKEFTNALADQYNNVSKPYSEHKDKTIKHKLTSIIQNMKQQRNCSIFSKTSSPNELYQAITNI